MTVKEAVRYQLRQLKGKPLKSKVSHIISYFWIPIVAVAVLIVLLISQVSSLTNRKDTVLHITCINAVAKPEAVEDYCSQLSQLLQVDQSKHIIGVDTSILVYQDNMPESYQIVQKLIAMVNAHETDLVFGDFNIIRNFAYSEYFCDLSDVLPHEAMIKYQDYLLYIDGTLLPNVTPLTEPIEYPDARKPETMTDPIPVALQIPSSARLSEQFYPHLTGDVAVSVVFNAKNTVNIEAFLKNIMEGIGG